MKKLHPLQKQLVDLLKVNIDDPLTIRELQEELKVSSTSLVYHHILQLEKKGYLKRNPNNPQDYEILTDTPDRKIVYLNLYGLATCGPRGSILDGNPVDRIPLSSKLLTCGANNAFLVKAKGQSMSPKIHDGDLVIAKKTNSYDNGDVVVCVNNGEALIKKIRKEEKHIWLFSINEKFEPFLAAKDFKVEGLVKSVLSYNLS